MKKMFEQSQLELILFGFDVLTASGEGHESIDLGGDANDSFE